MAEIQYFLYLTLWDDKKHSVLRWQTQRAAMLNTACRDGKHSMPRFSRLHGASLSYKADSSLLNEFAKVDKGVMHTAECRIDADACLLCYLLE